MIRNRRPAAAVAAFVLFAAAGVCGVVAARVVRAAWETFVQRTAVHTASANPDGNVAAPFSTTVTSAIYTLQVEMGPPRTGSNVIHLYARALDDGPLTVSQWEGTAGLPESGIEGVEIRLLPLTGDHAIGEVSLTAPGRWQLHLTIRISEIGEATVSVTVPVTQ
jgi:copper transport protein